MEIDKKIINLQEQWEKDKEHFSTYFTLVIVRSWNRIILEGWLGNKDYHTKLTYNSNKTLLVQAIELHGNYMNNLGMKNGKAIGVEEFKQDLWEFVKPKYDE